MAGRSGVPSSSAMRVTFSNHRQSSTGSVAVTATCATSPLSQNHIQNKNKDICWKKKNTPPCEPKLSRDEFPEQNPTTFG